MPVLALSSHVTADNLTAALCLEATLSYQSGLSGGQ